MTTYDPVEKTIYEYETKDLHLFLVEYQWKDTLPGISLVQDRITTTNYKVKVKLNVCGLEKPLTFTQHCWQDKKTAWDFIEALKRRQQVFMIQKSSTVGYLFEILAKA